jgi:hypothetical protein
MRLNLPLLVLLVVFSCSDQRKGESKSEPTSVEEPVSEKAESIERNKPSTAKTKASFKSISVLSGKVKMEVPKELRPMDAEMFELKYPLENPSTTIAYSDEDATVTLLISPRQEKATQADLPKYQQMLYESFGRNPSIDFKKSEIRKINGRDFIVIEMTTPAADTRVYNLMFVTSSEGRLLMGTFNCTVDKVKEWQPIAEQILSSVKVKD